MNDVVYMTIISGRYALRALALFQSLRPYLRGREFLVYCLDDQSAQALERLKLNGLRVVPHTAFETPALRDIRAVRSVVEYCWTLKPVVLDHALADAPAGLWAAYVDSDMYAFDDPAKAFPSDLMQGVVLTPHRYSTPYFKQFEAVAGRFNAGFIAFRASEEGRAALAWWKDRCLEAAPAIPVGDVYGDQKYLDQLSRDFPGVQDDTSPGLNAGPWNAIGWPVVLGREGVTVDGQALLLYHMQGFRILGQRVHESYVGQVQVPAAVRRAIYLPYAKALAAAWVQIEALGSGYRQMPDDRWYRPRIASRLLKRVLQGINNIVVAR